MAAAEEHEIRIKGRVSDSILASFDGFEADFVPAETVLHGVDLDQAALHGVIELVRTLGLELVEVRKVRAGRSG